MKIKSRNLIVVFLMAIAMLFGVFAITPLTANAASGTGTENDPVYVTNYAELKEELERDSDTWIVVNEFNNGDYYTLISGDDYSQTSLDDSAYNCGAINIPTAKNKHLTINTTIDCRTASTQQGSLLYCFINNRGNLTIDGNGTLAVSFNAGNYANAIILNQGNLTIDAPITLDATCKSVQSYGRAILNYSGAFTISDGTYIGFRSNTLGTFGNVGALWQASENASKESVISGGQFQIKDENGFVSNNYALVNSGVDNLTLKGGTFYGIYASQYSLKLSALLGSYCKFQKNGADFNGSSLSDSTDVLSVVNTNLISTVNLTVTAPLNGDNPSAPSISTDNVTIYAHEWKDSSESNMSSYSTFVGGETYRLQVRVNTTKEFSKNTEIYINGQIATVKSFAENTILCYIDYIASNEQIDTVQVGLDTPMVGGNVTEPYAYTSAVELTQHEWYPDVTQYEAGHNYKLTFRIVPKTGYEFSDDVKVVINGKQATIISQGEGFAICEYSFEFAAQEPETVDEINITVDNPVAGGDSPTPTVSSNQYTLGIHEWTPSEFVAGNNSKLTVLAYPSSGYKFVDGTTTAKINGHTATISIGNGYARIEYTFNISTPSYTVSFNANGGTGTMQPVEQNAGSQYTLPTCTFTAPDGKKFKAWSVNDVEKQVGDKITVDANTVVKAVWEDNVYQVIYQPGDTSGNNEVYEYEANEIITFLDCEELGYTRDGFEFDYWSIRIYGDNSIEVAQKRADETYTLTTDIIAVAMWKEVTAVPTGITATYSGTILAGNKINPSSILITLNYSNSSNEPVNAGIVEYWYNGSKIDDPINYVFGVELIGNLNITVKYQGFETIMAVQVVGYEITFNANTGSGTMESVEYVGAYTLPTCTFTAPDGKQFKGWATSANGEVINETTYNVTEPVTLYAIWENIPAEPTGLTASYNGTILAGNKIAINQLTVKLQYSDSSEMPCAGLCEYWYNGSKIDDPINYVFGVELLGTITITVKYQGFETTFDVQVVGYEITFNANTGSGTMESVEYVGAYTLPTCAFTAPDGKQFKGWSTSASGEVIDGATYNVTANVELFAIWEDIPVVKYDVTFNANGGTGTMSPVEYAGTYTLPTCEFTAPDGKQFKGWSTSANGEVIDGATYNVTANVELFAIWEDIPVVNFNVTFNANGGTGTMSPVEYAGTYTLPTCEFTAPDGKQFKGWSTSANGEVIDGATYNVTANVELFAIWEDIPHNHNHGTTWESDANNHWNECSCGDKANVGTHADSDNNGKCDTCDYQMSNGGGTSEQPENPEQPKDGLSGGAIAGIVVGSVVVLGLGGFALVWFVIKKKSFADLVAIFKKK